MRLEWSSWKRLPTFVCFLSLWSCSSSQGPPAANSPEWQTAISLNSKALEDKKQGNYQDAAASEQKAVQILQKTVGTDHPDTATALGNWAGILAADGKPEQAVPLYNQSIAIQQKVLGPDHPDLAASYAGLGKALAKTGKNREALPYLRRAVDIDSRTLGPENLNTGEVLLLMAKTAASNGDKELARSYLPQVDEIIAKNAGACTAGQPANSDCTRVQQLRQEAAASRAQLK